MSRGPAARRSRKFPPPEADPPKVIEAVAGLLPGEAAYAQWPSGEGELTTALLVRETREKLRTLGQHPRITMKCISLQVDGVRPLVVLIRVNDEESMTYDVWVDNCSPSGPGLVNELVEQKRLFLSFYTATTRRRRVSIYNHAPLKSCALRHMDQCRKLPYWTPKEFRQATASLCRTYPRPMDLWKLEPEKERPGSSPGS